MVTDPAPDQVLFDGSTEALVSDDEALCFLSQGGVQGGQRSARRQHPQLRVDPLRSPPSASPSSSSPTASLHVHKEPYGRGRGRLLPAAPPIPSSPLPSPANWQSARFAPVPAPLPVPTSPVSARLSGAERHSGLAASTTSAQVLPCLWTAHNGGGGFYSVLLQINQSRLNQVQ